MNPAIFDLIQKGLGIIAALVEAGLEAKPAIQALYALITKAKAGTVTDVELDATEAQLDKMIDDFNVELAP